MKPFVEAILSLHFAVNNNPDGGNPLGLFNATRSIDPKTAKRQDAISTYLKSTQGRSNIAVLVGAQARKIVFSEGGSDLVATGVEFEAGSTRFTVDATRQIVLSAGKNLLNQELSED